MGSCGEGVYLAKASPPTLLAMLIANDRIKVLDRAGAGQLDELAISEFGMSGIALMENAGAGCAQIALKMLGSRRRVAIFCGPGNNGGDGYVVARHLRNAGCDVIVTAPIPHGKLQGNAVADNAKTWEKIENCFGRSNTAPEDADLIIDALLGTGLDREISGNMKQAIDTMNETTTPVLAVDLPSGLDADTGVPLGVAVRADATATMACWKRGFLELESLRWTGEIHTIDIGVPQSLCGRLGTPLETVSRHGRSG